MMSDTKFILSPTKTAMLTNQQASNKSSLKELSTQVIDCDKNTSLHLAFIQKLYEKVDMFLTQLLEISNLVNLKNKHGLSYLHIASYRGNTTLVQKFIDAGADAAEFTNKDCPLYPNYTALQFACDSKSLETIKVLVKATKLIGSYSEDNTFSTVSTFQSMNQQNIMNFHHSSNNDCNALSLLHLACVEDNPDVIDCLLERKADANEQADRDAIYCSLYTSLHFAVEFNCKDNVKSLLENKADVDLRNGFCMTPVHLAMYYSHPGRENEILELLYKDVKDKKNNFMDANGLTYFHIAAAVNDLKTVKKLLTEGIDINQAVLPNLRNYSNYTALHFAVKYSHQKMVKLLVSRGANLNPREGVTPLQVACEIGHTSLVQFLVKHSSDAAVVDPKTGKTTLHFLVQNFVESNKFSMDFSKFSELSECIGLLIKHKVNVNAKDNDGNTVLHFACKEIHESELCVEELLDCGADVNLINKEGKTPLDLAWENSLEDECNYEGLAMLYHHVQKLKDLVLEVDAKNNEFCQKLLEMRTEWSKNCDWHLYKDIYDNEILEANHEKRLEEIEKLKGVKIDGEISLYEFLKFDMDKAREFVNCEGLKKVLEDPEGLWVKYPTYAYLIKTKREKILN